MDSEEKHTRGVGIDELSPSSSQTQEEEGGYYVLPESEDPNNGAGNNGDDHYSPQNGWRLLFSVIMNPVEGWKRLKRAKLSSDLFAQSCFYPILAILAISHFSGLFYENSPLQNLVVGAFILFLAYFLGFYTVVLFSKLVLPRDCRNIFDTPFGKNFILVALSTLAMIQILIELVPFLQPLFVFFPLYTIYIIVKGVRFLRSPENRSTILMTMLSLLTIGIPELLKWVFSLMIPDAQPY